METERRRHAIAGASSGWLPVRPCLRVTDASRGRSRRFKRFPSIGQAGTAQAYRQLPLVQYTIRIVDSGQIRESIDWSAFVSFHVVVFDA